MLLDRTKLEGAGREELIERARSLGVARAEVLTRVELMDEIVRLSEANPVERRRARGWLGVARDLLASVVEQGLNLPDAAALIRGDVTFEPTVPQQAPVATVTLAEIYAAQGHLERALEMLEQVLEREPDHAIALGLRSRFTSLLEQQRLRTSAPPPPPPVEEASAAGDAAVERRLDEPTIAELVAPSPADDALVVLRIGSTRAFLYSEQRTEFCEGRCRIRLVETEPSPSGARRHERTLMEVPRMGGVAVQLQSERAFLRAVLETSQGGHFRPLAVAVEAHVDDETGRTEVTWTPRARVPAEKLVQRAVACFRSEPS